MSIEITAVRTDRPNRDDDSSEAYAATVAIHEQAPRPASQHVRRTPLACAGSVVGWLFLAAAMAVLAVTIVIPGVGGATPYTILTGSMQPAMPPGTLAIVKPIDFDSIRIGDVVTYQLESGKPLTVTHRVTAVESRSDGETRLITQGDDNGAPDAESVREVQVKGKVWYDVPYVGWVNAWLTGAKRSWIVYGAAGGLLLYAAFMFATSFRKNEDER